MPSWIVSIAPRALKAVRRAPRHERQQLRHALDKLAEDPSAGDVVPLKNAPPFAGVSVTGGSFSISTLPTASLKSSTSRAVLLAHTPARRAASSHERTSAPESFAAKRRKVVRLT